MTRFSRRIDRRAVLAGATLLAPAAREARAQAPLQTKATAALPSARPLQINTRRIETFSRLNSEKRFGRLEFRGGLVLSASDKDFGGLSGLIVDADGRGIFCPTDAGNWVSGTIAYSGTQPTSLADVRIGPIAASSGRVLSRRRDVDAEAACLLEGSLARGTVLIAFERNHRIGRYPIIDRVLQPAIGVLKMPPDANRMASNKGLEALTVLAGGPNRGAVVALSERFVDGDGHHAGWIWIAGEPRRFRITDLNEFDLTDCASLADGSLLVLERRFRWTEGVKMQLRLFEPQEIAPGSLAKGTLIASATMQEEIDNLEGLSLHRDARGATVITMVSDDNFNSFLQRTILLQFTLIQR